MTHNILIIDDHPAMTRLLHSILIQAGYRVTVSNDPWAGQSLVDQERPDLVVLDVCMPGLDGYELCRRIRRRHRMPILMLSVRKAAPDVQRAYQSGADAYMSKPIAIDGFIEQVERLLHRQMRRIVPCS